VGIAVHNVTLPHRYGNSHPWHRGSHSVTCHLIKGKGSPHSITERRVPELIPVLGSQPAGDINHKPGGMLPLLSTTPAVTLGTINRAAISFSAWWTEARWVWTVCLRLLPDLRFEPRPYCAWVQHANHLVTKPPATWQSWHFRLYSSRSWYSI